MLALSNRNNADELESPKKFLAMRQSINQIRNTDTFSKGVQTKLDQEEGTFTVISRSAFQSFSVSQSFVVEWQMQKDDSKQIRKKASEIDVAPASQS